MRKQTTSGQLTGGRTADAKFNFGKKGWGLVLIAMLSYVVYMGFDNALNFIVPAFAARLNVPQTNLFIFSTIGGWISVAFVIIFGALQHRVGIKRMLMISIALCLVGALIWANAQNVAMYGIGILLVKGMGTVFCMVSFAEIGSNWFPTKKGNYMGVITLGVVIGSAFANGPVGTVIRDVGVTQGMMIFVVLTVALLILSAIFVKAHPEEAGAFPDNDSNMTPEQAQAILAEVKEYQRTSEWTVAKCLKSKTVWFVGLSFGLLNCVAQGLMSQLVPAAQSFGHSDAFAQICAIVPAPFALIGTLGAGVLDQKLGTKKVSLIIFVIAAAACLVGGLMGSTALGMIISAAGVAMAVSGGNNMVMSMSATIWGRFDFSTPYLVALSIFQFIAAFGYVVISGLADLRGGDYTLSFLCSAVIIVVGMVFCVMNSDHYLGRTLKSTKDSATHF